MNIIVFDSGIEQPKDKGILLKDIIENATADKDKSYCLDANYYKGASKESSDLKGRRQLVSTGGAFHGRNPENTSDRTPGQFDITNNNQITWRKLTPIECERLQTVPDNYTNHVSNSQRYKMLGNGWTISVISHIFRGLK